MSAVALHKARTGSVVGLSGTRTISNAELLALECDILIPAALENQIRQDNAGSVRARFICEAANGPTTPAADRILLQRGIPVLPDILANSGGVCAVIDNSVRPASFGLALKPQAAIIGRQSGDVKRVRVGLHVDERSWPLNATIPHVKVLRNTKNRRENCGTGIAQCIA